MFVWPCLLAPWCRVLLEKLTGLQLVKKFSAFYGTRRFITAFTSFRHPSLSWASPIQSQYPQPTSCRSILILSTHLRLDLPSGLFPSGFSIRTLYAALSSPIRASCPAYLILLDFITRTILGEEYRPFSSSLCNLLHSPVTSSLLGPNILLNIIFSNTLSFLSSLAVSDQASHWLRTQNSCRISYLVKRLPTPEKLFFTESVISLGGLKVNTDCFTTTTYNFYPSCQEWRSGYCAVTLSNYDLSVLWGSLPFSLVLDMSKSTARLSVIVIGLLRHCGRLHEPECNQTAALYQVGSPCTWRLKKKLIKTRFYLHIWSVEPAICKQTGSHFGMNTNR